METDDSTLLPLPETLPGLLVKPILYPHLPLRKLSREFPELLPGSWMGRSREIILAMAN
jgi:hypothetical protein